jgi:hypothetical protein
VLAIVISLALLYFLIGEFAPGHARHNRARVLALVVGLFVAEAALMRLGPPSLLWVIAVTLLGAAVVWLSLEKWCGIERRVAGKIAAIYTGVRFAVSLLLVLLQTSA